MLSARTIYGEILDNDEAFRLFCSVAASGEAQGGRENSRIAALVPGSQSWPRASGPPMPTTGSAGGGA